MIDTDDFGRMQKELSIFDDQREELIKRSRDLLRMAKKAIFMTHRGELAQAEKTLKLIEKENSKIKKLVKCNPKLDFIGAYSVAVQEYVEGRTLLGFIRDKKIPSCAKLKVQVEDYLLGLCDLTGELGRRAVMVATKRDVDEVMRIRDIIEEIFGLFLQLNLRNGELRKKSDAIKWNLKKVEDIVYDLKK